MVGADSLNAYYYPKLKEGAPGDPETQSHVLFRLARSFRSRRIKVPVRAASIPHRHSSRRASRRSVFLQNPHAYVDANLQGFINVLEGCLHNGCRHLVFASSSSVYGANTNLPFSVRGNVDHPISLYAAPKKANELMAHAYSHLYRIPEMDPDFRTMWLVGSGCSV